MTSRHVFRLGPVILLVLAALALFLRPLSAQDGGTEIRAGVVVLGADEQPQVFCVVLGGDNPTGADALRATGLDIVTESGTRGETVCRVRGDGCNPPGELCFCQCVGGTSCAYWNYFHLGAEGNWQYSPLGAGNFIVTDGAVEGWWWRDSAKPDAARLPVMTFDQICGSREPAFPRTVTDGLGREVTIPAPPQRIVSATLGSDEILYSLAGPERLLGVSFFAKDPAISNITDYVGEIAHADVSGSPEYLISLNPDLVILATYSNPATLDQLADAGMPVFVLADFNTLDDIRANIRLLGRVTGEETRAEAIIAEMDARLEAVRAGIAGRELVRVLFYEPGGITYGPGSTVDEIITLAGGVNVVAEAGLQAYPLVDAEFVLAVDPDVILLGGWYSRDADPMVTFKSDPAFRTLRAVREGRVYPINDAHMTNVSQYIADGVEDVAHALYPDAFERNMDDEPEGQ